MSEMVERVARAIHDAMDITDSLDATAAETYARAAIEAMREPTEDMLVDAGVMEGFNGYVDEGDEDRPHIEWWQAMIDKALEDK